MQKKYQVYEHGEMDRWGDYTGGLSEATTAPGRFFLDKEMDLDYFGVSLNSRLPGEGAEYWHAHSVLEELYIFLEGVGELALDDEIIPVQAGTAVRVGQGVMRTWRASPDSPVPLKWICIRAGGARLAEIPRDAAPLRDKPLPWK
ncbi:MAG: cupin domain-containing protein [Deltaproteobacteria bacterium]|nr:cupin domain-containing protein [Deltaproteobacteria bacterium]